MHKKENKMWLCDYNIYYLNHKNQIQILFPTLKASVSVNIK